MEVTLRSLHRVQPCLKKRSQPPVFHQCTESRFDLLERLLLWILLYSRQAKSRNLIQMFELFNLIQNDLA